MTIVMRNRRNRLFRSLCTQGPQLCLVKHLPFLPSLHRLPSLLLLHLALVLDVPHGRALSRNEGRFTVEA
jgi:hypothetical protein